MFADVRRRGRGGYGPVRTKADKGRGVDFYCIFANVLYG